MSVLDTLITDREQGATYGHTDVNRVNAAIKYVGDWLHALGLPVTISAARTYTRTDLPTYSMFDDIVGKLNSLKTAVKRKMSFEANIPECGTAQHFVTVYNANTIESIIDQLHDAAVELEGRRAWMFRTDETGMVTAYYLGDDEPEIDFYINDDDQLVATWPDGTPEPEFSIDVDGNLSLIYLEGE